MRCYKVEYKIRDGFMVVRTREGSNSGMVVATYKEKNTADYVAAVLNDNAEYEA